jgi:NTP pyrophosphatase (non-canonical NTP hydrolase)
MELKDLKNFIDIEDERLKKYYGNYSDQEKRILTRAVKVSEELGELCQEVLLHNSLQRKEKMAKRSDEKLAEEFADVLITTLLLAKAADINIEKALESKMQKINKRYDNI